MHIAVWFNPAALVLLFLAALLFPELAAAQQPIIAQCTGIDCQACHLFELFNNVIKGAIYLGTLVAVVVIAFAGVRMFAAAGNPAKVAAAKKMLAPIIIGYIFALAGVLVVDLVINSVAQKKITWTSVPCDVGTRNLNGGLVFETPVPVIVDTSRYIVDGEGSIIQGPGVGGASPGVAQCKDCVPVDSSIPGYNRTLSCTSQQGGACLISAATNLQLMSFASAMKDAGLNWQATELWPPTSSLHSAGCHAAGTCIDAAFNGTPATAANIAQFITLADKSGFRAQFEVKTAAEAQRIQMQAAQHGVTLGAEDILVVPYINGPHFSMYRRGTQ